MNSFDAVVLAGGAGTRLRPLTDRRPKPLVPFMGAPFADGLLARLRGDGCGRVTFLVGRDPSPFSRLIDAGASMELDVTIVPEETPLDTAGATRRLVAGTYQRGLLVVNGDILTDVSYRDLVSFHRRVGPSATLALMRVPDVSSYGVVELDDLERVQSFVEKPAPGVTTHTTVNAGTYVLDASVFDLFPGDGPLSFERDVFPGLLEAGRTVVGTVPRAHWQDLGTPRRLLEGHRAVLSGGCRWPIDPDMRMGSPMHAIHRGADVHETARLSGVVVIGRGCSVSEDATIENSVLFGSVEVGAGATVRESVVGARAHIGPDSVVGPGDVVGDGVHL
jgi:mannose-1-phosphate guanylyltransferase